MKFDITVLCKPLVCTGYSYIRSALSLTASLINENQSVFQNTALTVSCRSSYKNQLYMKLSKHALTSIIKNLYDCTTQIGSPSGNIHFEWLYWVTRNCVAECGLSRTIERPWVEGMSIFKPLVLEANCVSFRLTPRARHWFRLDRRVFHLFI